MQQPNISQFNNIAESVIRTGYANFPLPFFIDPASLGLTDQVPERNEDGEFVYSDEWLQLESAARATANWMKEEGYLWSTGRQFQLSKKALLLVPAFIHGADTPLIVNLG